MNKLFNFTQAKGKWHKFSSFNLGGGAKLYKNFAQKLLAVSLCMAMVLLGVPRWQDNPVEAAAATKSVALLTLTLTGDDKEPIKADMTWKSFVQGTTVGLEVVFVDAAGTASAPRDYGSWLDTYGSMEPTASGFETFAPSQWLDALGSLSINTELPDWFGREYSPRDLPFVSLWLSSVDQFHPLPLNLYGFTDDFFGAFDDVPGLAAVGVDSSLTLVNPYYASVITAMPFPAGASVSLACRVSPAAVASFADGVLTGLVSGTANAHLSAAMSHDNETKAVSLGTLHLTVMPAFLETSVPVGALSQRLRVYDPQQVIPFGSTLHASFEDRRSTLDNTHDIEHLMSYEISLLDSSGSALPMPLSAPVELWFEVIDGLDASDLHVVLEQEFADAEFEEELIDRDGSLWVKITTAHFSPYSLIDELSAEDKAALATDDDPAPSSDSSHGIKNNVRTGDLATQVTVAGLGMTLVLALGIMLRLITSKRKFEK